MLVKRWLKSIDKSLRWEYWGCSLSSIYFLPNEPVSKSYVIITNQVVIANLFKLKVGDKQGNSFFVSS